MKYVQKDTIGTHGAARCAGGRVRRCRPRALNATITPTPNRCVFGLRNIYVIGVHIVTKESRSERAAARSVFRGRDCHLGFDRLALREVSGPPFAISKSPVNRRARRRLYCKRARRTRWENIKSTSVPEVSRCGRRCTCRSIGGRVRGPPVTSRRARFNGRRATAAAAPPPSAPQRTHTRDTPKRER